MLLAIEALTVERGGRIVLSDLSFSLSAGETLHVLGRNGAGKSTLLRTIAGLLPPTAGRSRSPARTTRSVAWNACIISATRTV